MADRDEDEEDEDDVVDGAPDDAVEDDPFGEDLDLEEYDEEDEDQPSGGRGRLIAILAVVAVLVLGTAGGAYFFLFSGDDGVETASAPVMDDAEPGTSMAIPPAGAPQMLSGEELARQQAGNAGPPEATATTGGALTPPSPAAPKAEPAPEPAQPPTQTQAQAQASAPAAAPAPAPQPKGADPSAAERTPAASRPDSQTPGAGVVTPAVTAVAYRDIPLQPKGKPLSAPDPSLTETTDFGTLPKAGGGRAPWRAYAHKFEGPADKPRIAIVITGLGASRAATLAAIGQLPAPVTLAFDPYARNLEEWIGIGRSNGHEALLHLPMEPGDFPISDPGPLAMLTDLDAGQNIARMHQILAAGMGYVGVLQVMGSKFAASEAGMRPVLDELRKRGLLYVDTGGADDDQGSAIAREIGLPIARVDLTLDGIATAAAIDTQLGQLERIARERGSAIAVADAYPITISRLSIWADSLGFKELALAPVSALATASAPAPAQPKP